MKKFVAILMGSETDLAVMKISAETLKEFNIAYEINILSAHRTPDLTAEYVKDAEARGCQAFIAAAGMAAHLAGAVAAQTVRPVIGVPLDASSLGGLDSLLSTVQMPSGMPVATTAIGTAGAKNAAILAAQIFALNDDAIKQQLIKQRQDKRKALQEANKKLLSI